jgi:PHD/YefM family antitoxin component YafN of YafNO toxin-antitoxin module
MVAYENDELIPSSEFAKKFGTYLAQVKSHTVDKLAVIKNNRIEAVLVSKDEYEKMREALAFQEFSELKDRITHSLDELELIKFGKKKAHPIETLWDEI